MIEITRPAALPEKRLDHISAYDYEEFLHSHLLDYVTDNADRIRRRKQPDLCTDFMTCDIECTTVPAGIGCNKTDYAFAFPYLYQLYIGGRVVLCRYDWQFRHIIETIDEYMEKKNLTIVCYIHNASYEYQFFRSRIPLDNEKTFALQTRRIGKFETARHGILFRCSYLLSNMSLEKFTENYCSEEFRKDKELIDYEILRYPWDDLSNEILYYSAMDVITLYHAVKTLMEKEGDSVSTIPMTNTGYVRRTCRSACLGNNWKKYRTEEEKRTYKIFLRYRDMMKKCMPTLEQYQMLRAAFRGGNTHANRFKVGNTIENVGSYDFASSYPAAIICYDGFPMGKLMDCTAALKTPEDITRYCNRYWVCITAVFQDLTLRDPYNTLCPYIPLAKGTRAWTADASGRRHPLPGLYDNGRLISQEGLFEMTFLSCEWDIIRKQYRGRIYVKKAFYTIRGELPKALRQTCYEWYKAKTELKNVDGREYEYLKSKNRVNSVYGMMVEQIVKDIITVSNTGIIEQRKATPEEAAQQLENYLDPKARKFLLYQWGVTVTAICRVRHMEIIDLVGSDFVYGDTDSIKVENAQDHMDQIEKYNADWNRYAAQCGIPIQAVTKSGEIQTLGHLDYEAGHFSAKFRTLGAKKYATEDAKGNLEITIAGVPKKEGARMLQTIDNFLPGFTFRTVDSDPVSVRQNWKKMLTYRDDLDEWIKIDDHDLYLGSCIAMERTEYRLDITNEYEELTGFNLKFDEIYEEDPEIWE